MREEEKGERRGERGERGERSGRQKRWWMREREEGDIWYMPGFALLSCLMPVCVLAAQPPVLSSCRLSPTVYESQNKMCVCAEVCGRRRREGGSVVCSACKHGGAGTVGRLVGIE